LLHLKFTELLVDASEEDEAAATAGQPTAITALDRVAAIATNTLS